MVRLVASDDGGGSPPVAGTRRRRDPDAPRSWAPARDDGKKRDNPCYSFIGGLRGRSELRGVMQAVEVFRSGRAA